MSSKITLSDFVAETLASISDGVRRAQDHSHKTDGVPIAPNSVDGERLTAGDQLVRFHLVLETAAESEKQGKGQLGGPLVAVIAGSVDAALSTTSRNTSQHTIEFSVPMHFHLRWAAKSSEVK